METSKIKEIVNRNELRRLERAAREKDKKHLLEWAKQFEDQIRQDYEKAFEKSLANAIDDYVVAIAYALRFSEKTKFGEKRIKEFLDDVFISIDMFRTGEYDPEEYKQQLIDSGINIFSKKEEKGE